MGFSVCRTHLLTWSSNSRPPAEFLSQRKTLSCTHLCWQGPGVTQQSQSTAHAVPDATGLPDAHAHLALSLSAPPAHRALFTLLSLPRALCLPTHVPCNSCDAELYLSPWLPTGAPFFPGPATPRPHLAASGLKPHRSVSALCTLPMAARPCPTCWLASPPALSSLLTAPAAPPHLPFPENMGLPSSSELQTHHPIMVGGSPAHDVSAFAPTASPIRGALRLLPHCLSVSSKTAGPRPLPWGAQPAPVERRMPIPRQRLPWPSAIHGRDRLASPALGRWA